MKRLLGLILSLCMLFMLLLSSVGVSAASGVMTAKVGKNVTSSLNMFSNSLTISGSGDMYDFTSNFDDNGYIGWSQYLTDLTVTDGVTSIGDYAFYYYPRLKNVSLANSIKRIGEHAFAVCTSLKKLKIPTNLEKLDDYAFLLTEVEKVYIYDLDKWLTVDCGEYGSPIGTKTSIYVNDEEVKDLIIPNTVTTIKSNLFYDAKTLETVKIPESVKNIEKNAFYYKTTLLVYEGSYAHQYAKENNRTFQIITKEQQSATVSAISAKTYGDSGFKVEVTNDRNSDLGKFIFESSNTNVATIDEYGNVTIKNAGDTNITVKRGGNDTYIDFERSQKFTVEKADIAVTADAKSKRVGTDDPILTYQYTGTLVGTDNFTGELKRAEGETIGKYDILQGTLALTDNYDITYNKAIFEICEKEAQKATVSAISAKTYGDDGFKVEVTDDKNPEFGDFKFESTNKKVAEIDEQGNVTIKNAGETNIIVKRKGDDTYADFEKSQKLTVNKVKITVNAVENSKKIGKKDPELTYTYTGTLVGTDSFSGALTRTAGEEIGKYDILQGTLKLNDENYEITYNKAIFEIFDKTPQKIVVSEVTDKIYGDSGFKIEVTPDSESGLSEFTFESTDTNVAEIDANGNVTVKAAGTTTLVIKQAGDAEYAAINKEIPFTVAKKSVEVTAIDIVEKTAAFTGVLDSDTEVAIDLSNVTFEVIEAIDEENSKIKITGYSLKGEGSENYEIANTEFEASITNSNLVKVEIEAENGTASGAGYYLVGAEVTVKAEADSGYKFVSWKNGDVVVSEESEYMFTAETDVTLTAEFEKKTTPIYNYQDTVSTASSKYYTVQFVVNGGSKVKQQSVKSGERAVEPVAPTREGYVFNGWYTNRQCVTKYDFSNKVSSNVTVYAKWIEVKSYNNPFTDVSSNEWYYEAVKYVNSNGLMNGVTGTEFAPNDNLTRAMLVTILYRAEGEPAVNRSIPFADVTADSYYANAVIWAQQNGIVNGVSETEFAPDENITREQIATIIYRYAKYKGYDVSVGESTNILSYADYDEISEYAIEAMQYAVGSGLIKGKTETTLNPQDNATRAEIATILQRFIEMNK